MSGVPSWIPPTIAISLIVIAASFVVLGTVSLAVGLSLRRHSRAVRARLTAFTSDARAVTLRLKGELESFAELSGEARAKMRGAIDTVEGRLRDLDALVEVLQEEAEETALDIASLVRTIRRSGAILGAARGLRSRRRSRG